MMEGWLLNYRGADKLGPYKRLSECPRFYSTQRYVGQGILAAGHLSINLYFMNHDQCPFPSLVRSAPCHEGAPPSGLESWESLMIQLEGALQLCLIS